MIVITLTVVRAMVLNPKVRTLIQYLGAAMYFPSSGMRTQLLRRLEKDSKGKNMDTILTKKDGHKMWGI